MKKYLILLISASSLIGCSDLSLKEEINQEKPITNEVFNYLQSNGFKKENISNSEDYVILEGDIILSKKIIINKLEDCKSNKKARVNQYIQNPIGVVDWGKAGIIKYRIHGSVSNLFNSNDWITAIRQACSDWSTINDSKIRFVEVSTGEDLLLTNKVNSDIPQCFQNIPNNYFAYAEFAGNGSTGKFISINSTGPPTNFAGKLTTIRHEIGHTLGFRHSDMYNKISDNSSEPEYITECGNEICGSNLISGTGDRDLNSIMLSFGTGTNLVNFNNDDRLGARLIYPASLNPPTLDNIQYINSYRNIRVSVSNIENKAYNVALYSHTTPNKMHPTSQEIAISSAFRVPSGSTNVVFIISPPTIGITGGVFAKVLNYKCDFSSSPSNTLPFEQ